jgi:hypothetical protein
LDDSVVTGNRAIASTPYGRFAEGGGVMVDTTFSFIRPGASCTLMVRNSVISDNATSLTSTYPSFFGGALIKMNANGGGLHVGDGVPTTIGNAAIVDNSTTATDPDGEPGGFDAGVNIGNSPVVITNSQIDDNQATTTSATSADVGPSGSAIELDGTGTISNASIIGNSATSISPAGAAATNGGLAVFNGVGQLVTVQDSVISRNTTEAISTTGSATVQGGAVFNNGLLLMRDVQVTDNVGRAEGPSGAAQGGGIWNGVDQAGPTVVLTLEDTNVIGNVLEGSSGTSLQGGGLFTTSPVTLTGTRIILNYPDQCDGC